MRIHFNRGNEYFDTYYVYDDNGALIGMYEDHCRGVKQRYFVGWKLKKPLTNPIMGETKSFDTKEEAINYAMS